MAASTMSSASRSKLDTESSQRSDGRPRKTRVLDGSSYCHRLSTSRVRILHSRPARLPTTSAGRELAPALLQPLHDRHRPLIAARIARAQSRLPFVTLAVGRSSSAAGSATVSSAASRRTSTSRSSACRPIGFGSLLERLGRVETVGESFQVFKMGDIDVSLPRRESKSGRGHRGFDVSGDPDHEPDRRRPPPRLHHQRHLLGSAGRTRTPSMLIRSGAAAT